jgi:hypothetical protein
LRYGKTFQPLKIELQENLHQKVRDMQQVLRAKVVDWISNIIFCYQAYFQKRFKTFGEGARVFPGCELGAITTFTLCLEHVILWGLGAIIFAALCLKYMILWSLEALVVAALCLEHVILSSLGALVVATLCLEHAMLWNLGAVITADL